MYQRHAGFSLVEILVVIAIIGILIPVLYANFSDGREQSRDAERQTTLRTLQSAIELYKNEHGRYPERCPNGAGWSGQPGTSYECTSGSNEYILGNSGEGRPFSEYVQRLPQDRVLNGANSGYVYTVNADGSVYKLMAFRSVESEEVGYDHPLFHCDYNGTTDPSQVCLTAAFTSNNLPQWCNFTAGNATNREIARRSYGVWGGFATPTNVNLQPGSAGYRNSVEQLTENVICAIP